MTSIAKPSPAETAILQVLWEHEPCSVKAIHERLSQTKSVGYTTTLKQIQRMHDKGLVTRVPGEGKSYDYSAAVDEASTKSRLFDRFVKTAFEDSVPDLVMHALGTDKASPDDIEKIREFLEKLDKT
ncbi:BlaI/MecI/CopY family transcriptional regulator [uncultured Algimonas sp.]|uniref:BlaI/MecI/CopY family transcriptional regulator n=1 Tax=uncultured Algimonas sp. TaxID=1547920 RepID=UPI0026174698|nr:BlaI/MecI/CopY family transcriptional regulator [uncultured Algimonas sp.]